MEVLRLLIVREAHAVLASLIDWLAQVAQDHIDRLLDLLALLEDVLTLIIIARLEGPQVLNHKVRVLLVLPSERDWHTRLVLEHFALEQVKVHLELVQEVLEQEVLVDVPLNVIGQFIKQVHVVLSRHGIVLIVVPVVLEVGFELGDHGGRQRFVIVKILEEQNPSRKLL